ncbi:MAG: hypothetical protein ACNFW9_05830 [Candidatus Kerfeldbacteria bacterium]|jgi:hypothetical protein
MVDQKCSKIKKGFLIFLFGVVMVIVTNIFRAVSGDVPSFIVGNEGLTWAILLFAFGAGFIGWFTSNPDRKIFGWFVFTMGFFGDLFVFFGYDKSGSVLITFFILILVSSLSIRLVETKAP